MPPGRRIRRDHRVRHAVVLEAVRGLQTARAAADDDDGVLPGREGTLVRRPRGSAPPAVRVAQPPRLRLEHAVHDLGVVDHEALDGRAGDLGCSAGSSTPRRRPSAARPSRIDTSPKKSPRPSVARCWPSIRTSAVPSRMTKNPEPVRPWRRIRSPGRKHDLLEHARRRPSSCGGRRSPNSVNPARMSAISSRVAIRPCLHHCTAAPRPDAFAPPLDECYATRPVRIGSPSACSVDVELGSGAP